MKKELVWTLKNGEYFDRLWGEEGAKESRTRNFVLAREGQNQPARDVLH